MLQQQLVKSNPWVEKIKLEVVDLISIVWTRLESCRLEIVKLKIEEEDLASKVGNVEMVLDSI
jgi:hypothetical protein